MIQGGGFEPGMKQKAGRAPIEHEGVATSKAGLRNAEYTVAMARTNEPHSGSSQFFVNVADNAFLDFKAPSGNSWGYTVFGKSSFRHRRGRQNQKRAHRNIGLPPKTCQLKTF